MLTEMLWFG